MIVLVAHYYVLPGQMETVLQKLTEMAQLVRAEEPGCLLYQVSRAQENENLLMLYELYADETAVQTHRDTAHFQSIILDSIIPLLEKREVAFYDLQLK